jgi:acyl-CoA hydrolase
VTPKPPSASVCRTVELVLPNDTNTLGNLMGGRLLHLMDICAAIAAQRHSNRTVVTASVDTVDFESAIALGEVVALEAIVNRAFTTSMEVGVEVWAENNRTAERRRCNQAFFTFVAVDQDGRPIPVPPVAPETEAERARYDGAARRRDLRLVLAGRIALADAGSLRDHLDALPSRD